ncbi:molybdenum cofactor guanylyltransferase [Dyella choica]|uniref:molybdenum cofactor guanylyltransferase n=1 Tax=Dyella choica TaxID=1927959 RepID=UPI001E62EEF0|nr:NTP transferase domain-containing protein [Dyella choica]
MAEQRMPTGTSIERLPLIGVVLAGGLSTRMGRDKALLHWQGRPLLEHQMAVLHAAGVCEVKVSGDRPDYHGVVDPVPQAGPIGGIAGIAAACDDAELLIVPVDMPRLQPALLQRLREAASAVGCVRFAGHVLPMRLRLDARCRDVLNTLVASSDRRARSLRSLQERIGVHEIVLSGDEATQLIDCNTEETWREAST